MTTLEDFKAAVAIYRSKAFVLSGATLAFFLVGDLTTLAVVKPLRAYLYGHLGEAWGGAMLGAIPGAPALIAMFFALWKLERWAKRDGRLICPSCRRSLAAASRTVIASGNCPSCGKCVLAKDPQR